MAEIRGAFFSESDKLYTCGDNRHGKLCQEEEELEKFEGPQLVKKFENYFVTNVACGGCHTILSAQKTEEEYKRTINLPPLQRIPMTSQDLHGIKADSIESTENVEIKNESESEKLPQIEEKEVITNGNHDEPQESNPVQEVNPEPEKQENLINSIKTPSAFTTEISDGIEEISTTISAKQEEVKNLVETSVTKIEDQANTIKENVATKVDEIKNDLDKNLEEITTKTENFMHDVKEKVEKSTQEKIDNFVKEAKDGLTSEIDKFVSMTGVKSFLGNKSDSIENLLDEINDEDDEDSKSSNEDAVSVAPGKVPPE